MYKKLFHVTLGSREDRDQVPHVMDSDSDCRDTPNFKQPSFLHTNSKLHDSFFWSKLISCSFQPNWFHLQIPSESEEIAKTVQPSCRIRVKVQVNRCCITFTWAQMPCMT